MNAGFIFVRTYVLPYLHDSSYSSFCQVLRKVYYFSVRGNVAKVGGAISEVWSFLL